MLHWWHSALFVWWLASNLLLLNADKIEVLIVGPDSIAAKVADHLGSLSNNTRSSLRNLCVTFDHNMLLDNHIKSLSRTCFFQLKNISKLRPIISHSELQLTVHAFISSRLDYCNSLFTCLNKSSLHRLQLIQNAAARLLTCSRKSCHITLILRSLHWLPIAYRFKFKVLVITFNALHGSAPSYISDLLQPYSTNRSLRSSTQGLLVIPRTRLKTKGDRAFQAVAPRLWNALPSDLRASPTLHIFKAKLKTHLFRQAFQ